MDTIRITLMEAIVCKRVVATRYNGEQVMLAPHLLFERHGDLFVGAVNLSKNWRADEERRLGQFKLAGLGVAELLDEQFDPLPAYRPEAPAQGDVLVMAV